MRTISTNRRVKLWGAAISLLAGSFASSTQAAVPGYIDFLPAWTSTASSCNVDEVSQADYATTGAALGFKFGSAALNLYAWCNVVNPLDAGNPDGASGRPLWNHLIVGFRDPDGKGTNARVRAYLYRVSRSNGSSATIASFDSNAWNNPNWQEGLISFSPNKMDFLKYSYHVYIWISRSTTQVFPYISTLRIANATKIPG